ncbi:hypothetical protein GJV26_05800 [Massilia dura]|uniref:Uncharacterized protein n=1 Tax=Pseudoduganella dura TaxID=321982 RepID=A0A6I3X8G4_9BURK|nr:hypothetical protein [Pseudoduganella dura]MUI11996.1 hypothetical protein [Pseudoduganella dura]GGX84818.1 hypothetical protein GCM10007386_14460 [Pseudoduganella dura]
MENRPPTMGAALTWAHSFEEDEGDIQVYRPRDTFPFPSSRRGRETLVIDPSGHAMTAMPGPDDRMSAQQPAPPFDIVEASGDVLKVRKR